MRVEATGPVPGSHRVASRAAVAAACERLAAGLAPLAAQGDCLLLGILLGGMFPLVRVAGLLTADVRVDVCRVSRYRQSVRGGSLQWLQQPTSDIAGSRVVLIDDIYDEGFTLEAVAARCSAMGAASVTAAVLVRKNHARPVAALRPDFIGIEIPDEFVFGCGMDYGGRWRHLPEIFGLRPA